MTKIPPPRSTDIRAALDLARLVEISLKNAGILDRDKSYNPREILDALRKSCTD